VAACPGSCHGSTGSCVYHDYVGRGVALVVASPGCSSFKFLVVRGWMVGEKKKAEEYSAAKGVLRVSTRVGLQVSDLGLASALRSIRVT
jgi:hypothetical protein